MEKNKPLHCKNHSDCKWMMSNQSANNKKKTVWKF